jgi:dihydroxyacetone kinase-like protein
MIRAAAQTMTEERPKLIELDSAIGDGDLGITMEKGWQAAAEAAEAASGEAPQQIFSKAAMAVIRLAPSTMGTLMGSGLLKGSKAVAGKSALGVQESKDFLAAFLQGAMERGKAKPGEKTLIDVLVPASDAANAYSGSDAGELWQEALKGAEKGLEIVKGLEAQHGKAAVFREKTIGMDDPGGYAVYLMIRSFAQAA